MEHPFTTEELITQFISLGQEDTDRAFRRGAIAFYLVKMGETFNTLSSKVNCSPEQIRVLVRTFEAFPDEEERTYHELSYYHYRLAARTDEPHQWMQRATDNEWSTRELAKAIKQTPVPDEFREAERLLYKVKLMLDDPVMSDWFAQRLYETLDSVKCVLEEDALENLMSSH